jgi:membrane peptidoglycan carboxypeptidase
MDDVVSSQSLETAPHRSARWRKVTVVVALCVGGLTSVAYHELRTSATQSWLLSRYAASLSYEIAPGPSPSIAFPRGGPFDAHRGYPRLGDFSRRLTSVGYTVAEQARQSAGTIRFVRWGVTPPYREPAAAGLVVRDFRGESLYDARPGDVLFPDFEDIPALVVNTLLFLENRELTSPTGPGSNPAIDWRRLGKAGGLYLARGMGLPVRSEGGSTLAVQLEKYRHSESGRTASPLDKLRQLTAASLRAYRDGPDSTVRRREIVLDYLNTMPLAAAPRYGEVHGLGNGLRAWFDLDLDIVEEALAAPSTSAAKADAYKHVLALLYAVRAPTRYLVEDQTLLEKKIGAYGDLLLKAGVIDRELHRTLRDVPLRFGGRVDQPPIDFAERRASTAIREEVRRLLGVRNLYEMDRLHLEIESTIDGSLQETATRLFRQLGDQAFVDARGLRAEHLLLTGDPRHVVYSLLLFERTPSANLLRVKADNLDRPFDINSGMKLDLGSTAKLRTLAHYLEVVAGLHQELAGLDPDALGRRAAEARDPVTRWAAETLGKTPALDLEAFLAQALARKYSANPSEAFFTGGGVHSFENFDPDDNGRVLQVHEALAHSTNLVFIRLMRDLVRFHEARLPYDTQAVLEDPDHPERHRMLEEMADKESRQYLARAHAKYQGLESSLVLKRLLGERVSSPRHLAMVFFAWHPGGDAEGLHRWAAALDHPVTAEDAAKLVRAYGSPKLTLLDYGYLLGRHPLEVWCAGEMSRRTPSVTWDELVARSSGPRRLASTWLLQERQRHPQDLRVRIQMEQDAFARMTPYWRRLGFPFEQLVPSYATAIGSSADRPAALAELMGIIANDGVRRPTLSIQELRFASDTPYHTVFQSAPGSGERVLPLPVARALRRVLAEVVESGTARRVAGVFQEPGGKLIVVGGKTGSGDNRFDTFAGRGRLISSRPVSRTAAFAFYIGDRYFGIITASVAGKAAAQYQFTSALPLTVLKLLAPQISAHTPRDVVASPAALPRTTQAQDYRLGR